MEDTEFNESIINERKEVEIKLNEIHNFIHSDKYLNLSIEYQNLLYLQYEVMRVLQTIVRYKFQLLNTSN